MGLDTYHRERGDAVRLKNRKELGLDPDDQADRLRECFKRISRKLDLASKLRRVGARLRHWLGVLCISVSILGGAYFAIATTSPWPVPVTVRHLMAAPNCDAARAVGLAPAERGEPGYWLRHDADGDGLACEPWPWKPIILYR